MPSLFLIRSPLFPFNALHHNPLFLLFPPRRKSLRTLPAKRDRTRGAGRGPRNCRATQTTRRQGTWGEWRGSLFTPGGDCTYQGRGLAGSVELEFTLANPEGPPTDIRVTSSSLYNELDDAAIEYLKLAVMTTTCVGQRYRIRVTFKLGG